LRIQNEDPAPVGAEVQAPEIAMPQSFACLHHHLIFSTKGRTPVLVGDLPSRLYAYVGGIIRTENGTLVAAGGMPDRVHFLISLSRESSVSDVLRQIKGSSSRWIHETMPDLRGFAWQGGYAAFAVSFSHVETVKQYIATQADHHRTVTCSGRISVIPAATQS
jgi:REP element-mobilizing transposase RayT